MKKMYSTLTLLLFCSLNLFAQDPCATINTISCGDNITFAPSIGDGNPNYPVNVGASSSCNGSAAIGGKEQIYSFTAPQNGTYELEATTATGGFVQFLWKNAALGCDNTGWTCIDRINSIGSIGAVNFAAGTTYYILLNSETSTGNINCVFRVKCAKIVCNDILTLTCGTTATFGPVIGYGDPDYSINVSGSSCNGSSAQGGKEQIYSFIAPQDGTYEFEVTSSSGGFVQYLWKQASLGCDSSGWNCIERTNANGSIGAINFLANTEYYILVNSEAITQLTQVFRIKCAKVVCNDILPLTCGTATTFGPAIGYGDPDYSVNVSNSSCNGSSAQGGKEQIYLFTAPQDGTYEFEVTSSSGGFAQYLWKQAILGCDSSGWNCIERTNATGSIGAINLVANTQYYFLVNSETISSLTQIFRVKCAKVVCNDIIEIGCGTPVTFGPVIGFGDPDYSVNVSGSACNGSATQGGKEQIYLLPASSSNYEIEITAASGGFMQYLYKPASLGCDDSGWICLQRKNDNGVLTNQIPASNTPIYLLVNSENTGTNTQVFRVSCTLGNEQFDSQILAIYPNPTNSKINLQLPNDVIIDKVSITDTTGKKVLEQNRNTSQISVENLAKGLYIIEAYAADRKFQSKFIKE